MLRFRSLLALPVCALLTVATLDAQSRSASHFPTPEQAGLQPLHPPGGGGIFYGNLPNDKSLQAAMVTLLRSMHSYFGERPLVDQFFQARGGSDSIAAFFTVNAPSQGGGSKKFSGLMIASMPQGSAPSGAVLFDDAAHFPKSEPAMMKTLNEAWRTAAQAETKAASTSAGGRGTIQPLHQATGGDRSATVGLPEGWQITGVHGGALTATGPNGELAGFGLLINMQDPRGGRPAYRGLIAGSCGGDIFGTYTYAVNQRRQANNLPAATWKLISSNTLSAGTISVAFEVDYHDGKGLRRGSAQVTELCTSGRPTWGMGISNITAPIAIWEKEKATFTAMYKSYSQDESVIRGETQRTIDNIHAIGDRARQQAADADSRRVASSQAFNQHMDNIDRQSKAFQNYQFDSQQLQVVGDDGNTYRGTVNNNTASALIQADPNRFQTVPTASFIKGLDY